VSLENLIIVPVIVLGYQKIAWKANVRFAGGAIQRIAPVCRIHAGKRRKENVLRKFALSSTFGVLVRGAPPSGRALRNTL
jgi:hypothetical protein